VKLSIQRTTFTENYPGSDVTPEEFEFLKAIERYQRLHERRYPTWREVLFVIRCLGYRKVVRAVAVPAPGNPIPRFPDTHEVPVAPEYPVAE